MSVPNEPLPGPEARSDALQREIARLERVRKRSSPVLVVDDMQTMRLLLIQTLKGAGFNDIHRAADGDSALRLMRQHACDLALVDWNMPRMDGLELLDMVRSDFEMGDMVFIMVTAETQDTRVFQAAEERQDAYLTKPISPEKLSRRLDLILEKRLTSARALRLESMGETDQALEQFMAAGQNRPRARWPLFGLGGLLRRQGRLAEAQSCYQRILEMDPGALAAMLEMGRLKEEMGDDGAGRGFFRRALELNPLFFKAYDALAASLMAGGDLDGALEVLNQAMLAQGSENAQRQELLGRLLLAKEQYAEAESAFAKALELRPRRNPVENNLALGRARLAQGFYDSAIPPLKRAAAAAAANGDGSRKLEATLQLGKANAHAGRLAQAEAAFASLEDPDMWGEGGPPFELSHLRREVGGVYLEAGQTDKARDYFLASLCSDPEDALNLETIAEICQEAGLPQMAEGLGSEARILREQTIEELSRRGLALVARGRFQDARAAYDQGLALDPGAGRLHFNLSKLEYRLDETDKAVTSMASAAKLGLARGDWELVVEAARFFAGQDNTRQAEGLLKEVLRLSPDHAPAKALLAELRG